ncbi:hypothetical protein, partial [Enterococcus avium]
SGFLFFLAIVYSPLDLIVEKEKPRSNHLPRINGYLHGLYYTLAKSAIIIVADFACFLKSN